MIDLDKIESLGWGEMYTLQVEHIQKLVKEGGFVTLREGANKYKLSHGIEEGKIYKMYNVDEDSFTLFTSNTLKMESIDPCFVCDEALYFETPKEDVSEELTKFMGIVAEVERLKKQVEETLEEYDTIIAPPEADHIDWNRSDLYC